MVPTRIKFTLKIIVALLSAGIFVLGGIWFYEEFQASQYQSEVPFELQLKVSSEEILYSEAYKNGKGRNEIKYAYLAGEVSPTLDEDVARRTPTSQTVVLDTFKDEAGKPFEKLKTTFTASPQFFEDKGVWKQIEYATTTQEIFSMSGAIPHIKKREFVERGIHKLFGVKPAFAAVSTFYPNPDVETTSVDGYAEGVSSGVDAGAAFTACRGLTNGTLIADSGTSISMQVLVAAGRGNFTCTFQRGFILFDTSSMDDAATIQSATTSLYVIAVTNGSNDGSDYVSVYTSSPASNTGLVTEDYDQVGTVEQSTTIDLGTLAGSAYNHLVLNSTGRGNISRTSITKFGIRIGNDAFGTSMSGQNLVTVASAETTGTSQDPKLEVTYTTPSAFSMGMWFPF